MERNQERVGEDVEWDGDVVFEKIEGEGIMVELVVGGELFVRRVGEKTIREKGGL